jgi:subtilisin family serine protease
MFKHPLQSFVFALAVLMIPLSARAQTAPGKVRIQSADELPRHTYPVPESATRLVEDDAQFAVLAAKLAADLRGDLAKYEIGDRATLKGYYGTLGSLALLAGDHAAAQAYADSVRAVEDKPALRLLAGTLERSLAATARAPASERERAFEAAYRREIGALPYDVVQAELRTLKGSTEMVSPGLLMGLVHALVEPAARSGEISRELADRVVQARTYLTVLQPYQDRMVAVLSETIAAHAVEKPDIWGAREVSLDGRGDLTPVVIGIWDTGVDVAVFDDLLFTNAAEIPDNGVDDDGNGYVDDVHGIAHDLHGRRASGVLHALTYGRDEEATYRRHVKGFTDLDAGIDSDESSEFRRLMAGMSPEEAGPFFEGFIQYLFYAHGTHVAGIAVAGNPASRILVGRLAADYRLVRELPTLELAMAWATAYRESIDYFRRHGARVVNMSWGFMPEHDERTLEAHNVGASAQERQALARKFHDIMADALREAIAAASDILFVAAAGNWDDDNRFGDFAPAAFDLPNLITAAAVDRAGDEAAFTSYGKVEIYANGYEVVSFLPGGHTMPLSGTSMAAPQVVNLAGKLLAVYPNLTVAQLRDVILGAAEEKTIGAGKTIMLLNPARSFDLAGKVTGGRAP